MKTLLISEIFPPKVGGSGRWFWEIYSRLPREEYLVAAGVDDDSALFDTTHDMRCARWHMALPTWGIASLKGMAGYLRLFRLLRTIVKKEGIQAVHCGRCLPEGLLGWLSSRFDGTPYTCYVHGEELNTFSKSRELSWLSRIVFQGAYRIIANTENTGNLLLRYQNIKDDRVKVLHPGVDISFFRPAPLNAAIREQLGWTGRKVLLTVGRLQKRKGHDYTIKALNHIRGRIPDILYVIVGDGEELCFLLELVKAEGLEKHVRFLGKADDETLLNCYQQCDAFILANRDVDGDIEGFGMVLVEAQACGAPVIAGNSGGTAEAMAAGETGILVDSSSPEFIARSVVQLLEDEIGRSRMSKKAVAWARENFDWNALTEKAEHIFNGH